MIREINIKAEFEVSPIRHLAIQCPKCDTWFKGTDILVEDAHYEYDLMNAECHCPKCGYEFEINYQKSNVDEDERFPAFYDKCAKRKTTWE